MMQMMGVVMPLVPYGAELLERTPGDYHRCV